MTLTATPAAERRVVLDGVSWSLYQTMLAEIDDGHVRLTFDQGRLEIMSPSPLHERVKKILARLIEAYADEMTIPVEGFGSTTFDREDLQKGLEPDECYYIANAAAVMGKDDFDWAVDPPPDLAVEIDISPPDVQRQPIYAALGVREIWKFNGRELAILERTQTDPAAGAARYQPVDRSIAFPGLPAAELNRWVAAGLSTAQTAAVPMLREWCRDANRTCDPRSPVCRSDAGRSHAGGPTPAP